MSNSKQAPILYHKDYYPKKLPEEKLKNMEDNVMQKVKIKTIDGESVEAMLVGIKEFKQACITLNWDKPEQIYAVFCPIL